MRNRFLALLLTLLMSVALAAQQPAPNGFTGTDLIVPAAGRVQGADGTQFTTTLWVTNPTQSTVTYQLQFLQSGQSNLNPVTISDSIAAGQTKVYDNVVQTTFGLNGLLGAVRVVASQELFVSSNVITQSAGSANNEARGQIFSAIPASFGIGAGETSLLQGVKQGGEYRYNVLLVESSGHPASVTLRFGSRATSATLRTRASRFSSMRVCQPAVRRICSARETFLRAVWRSSHRASVIFYRI